MSKQSGSETKPTKTPDKESHPDPGSIPATQPDTKVVSWEEEEKIREESKSK